MKPFLKKIHLCAFAAAALVGWTSCDSMVYDDLEECPPSGLRLPFVYDMNMKFADAFLNEVAEVDLYVYTTDGQLARIYHDQGENLKVKDYTMNLDDLQPGTYDLVAWAHGDAGEKDFSFSGMTATKESLHYTLGTESDQYGLHSTTDLRRLYHASQRVTVPDFSKEIVTLPAMKLTKDTNVIRVLLQHLDGSEIAHEHFDFAITENFTRLSHENLPADFTPMTYRAWDKKSGIAGTEGTTGETQTGVATVIAELTTSRLMTPQFSKDHHAAHTRAAGSTEEPDTKPMLNIVRKSDGKTVVRIPLTDYLLMIKGNHNRKMTDQEFLDRQDDYTLHFFLDENNNWYMPAGIYINSWKIVLQNSDL